MIAHAKIDCMEKNYTCYERLIDGKTFYFVKGYTYFPEHPEIPQILDHYGMHKDVLQACRIAGINDKAIINTLYRSVKKDKDVKVISMNFENQPSLLSSAKRFLSKIKIASFL